MAKCISNKKTYLTEDIAAEALIQAHVSFDFSKGDGPIAVYRCEDCGNYHLTSRGPMNAKLASYLQGGKHDRDKEAERWLRKFKDR